MTTNRIATYYRHLWQPPAQPPMVQFIVLLKGLGKSKHKRERYVFLWVDGDEGCRRTPGGARRVPGDARSV